MFSKTGSFLAAVTLKKLSFDSASLAGVASSAHCLLTAEENHIYELLIGNQARPFFNKLVPFPLAQYGSAKSLQKELLRQSFSLQEQT
jgi:hypothetical protein